MADEWYFARDGKTSGPFSAARLQELAAAGEIRPQDAVWKEGMDRRVIASKVKGLFAVPPAPPPAPAPAAEPPPIPEAAEKPAAPPGPEPAAAAQPDEAAPAEAEPPAKEKLVAPPQPTKVMRVIGIKGGVLASQDGTIVRFRKQCLRCGYNDTSISTMRIRSGTTRVNFFCPKCRKSQLTEIQGAG